MDLRVVVIKGDGQAANQVVQRVQRVIVQRHVTAHRRAIQKPRHRVGGQAAAQVLSVAVAVGGGNVGINSIQILAVCVHGDHVSHGVTGDVQHGKVKGLGVQYDQPDHVGIAAVGLCGVEPVLFIAHVVNAHEQNGNYVVPVIVGVALLVDPIRVNTRLRFRNIGRGSHRLGNGVRNASPGGEHRPPHTAGVPHENPHTNSSKHQNRRQRAEHNGGHFHGIPILFRFFALWGFFFQKFSFFLHVPLFSARVRSAGKHGLRFIHQHTLYHEPVRRVSDAGGKGDDPV